MTFFVPVGIDLGTTFSAAAYVDEASRSEMVRNAHNEFLTPTAVFFGDDSITVGKEAKKQGLFQPDCLAECVKRDIGGRVYAKAIRGRFLPPEFIQAHVLRRLGWEIKRQLQRDFRVVLTVPAFFDEPRRKATADAGEIAGLNVLDIVNEPTAAALAFGEQLGYLSDDGVVRDTRRVLVYDLGGGTFDATLVELGPDKFKTIATDGDVRLGGRDWDQRLVDFAAEQFIRQYREDPRSHPVELQKLFLEAEEAKHTLSVRSRAPIVVSHAGNTAHIEVERERFEALTEDLLERTALTVQGLLRTAGCEWSDLHQILLCGGATRMPQIARMLARISGRTPDRMANPDQAVARGAAIYCAHRLRQGPPKFEVVDVCSHSLGILGVERASGRNRNSILIPRNTPLPAEISREFVTRRAGQSNITVRVLEGEGVNPESCTALGKTVVHGLPDSLPAGWPVKVTYAYLANGRLTAHADVPGTTCEAKVEFERAYGLHGNQLLRWKRVVEDDESWDAFDSIIVDSLPANGKSAEQRPQSPYWDASEAETAELDTPLPAVDAFEPADDDVVAWHVRRTGVHWSWLGKLAGHAFFSALGLVIGYWVLCYINPDSNFLELDLPGIPPPKPGSP